MARRFTEIKAQNGPDALAFISSSKCTNEESYLMQKLARAVIGTNNMDNCSRYCQAPATDGSVPHGGLRRRFRLDQGHREGRPGGDHRQQHGREPPRPGHPRQAGAQAARPEARSSPICANTRWRSAPIFFSSRSLAPIWSGFRAVTRYILDNGLAKTDFPRPVGQRTRGILARAWSRSRWSSPRRRAGCRSRR